MSDRVVVVPQPPISNVSAEATLLGGLMLANNLIERAADFVRVDDFAEPLFGRIWAKMLRLHADGVAANPVTLRPYFIDDPAMTEMGGPGFLATLSGSSAAIIGALDCAKQVGGLANRRRFAAELQVLSRAAEDHDITDEQLVSRTEAAVVEALQSTTQASSIAGSVAVDLALAEMSDERPPGVTCGLIPSLDRVIGAIRPGWLVILAGRPGMGKTATAISYAHGAAAQGFGVDLVSLEMRAADLGGRLACDVAFEMGNSVPYERMTEGGSTIQQRNSVARAAQHLRDLPLWIEDLPSATMSRLQAVVRRAKQRFIARGQSLQIVIIDYLQLLRPDQREKDLYQAISAVSLGLKQLAKEEGVGVLALCQLSRSVEKREDKTPRTDDLRDSGQIEQDADVICFILRREEYMLREQPREAGLELDQWRTAFEQVRGSIDFIVPKRRFGRPGTSRGLFSGDCQAVRG